MSSKNHKLTDSSGRDRILDATWSLLRQSPNLQVRVADIAAAAGVSRQAVYLHFGNRANLLLEAVRYRDRTSGLTNVFVSAAREAPLTEALAQFVRGWFSYVPHIQPVVQLLSAAAQIDPETRMAWDDRMTLLRTLIETLCARLAAAGMLCPPWTQQSAAGWIWHQTHIDSWRHLTTELGWTKEEAVLRVTAALERELLRDVASIKKPAARTRRAKHSQSRKNQKRSGLA